MAEPINGNIAYTAFLSYSRHDDCFAKRIHTWVEKFVIPRSLRSNVFGKIGFEDSRIISDGVAVSAPEIRGNDRNHERDKCDD